MPRNNRLLKTCSNHDTTWTLDSKPKPLFWPILFMHPKHSWNVILMALWRTGNKWRWNEDDISCLTNATQIHNNTIKSHANVNGGGAIANAMKTNWWYALNNLHIYFSRAYRLPYQMDCVDKCWKIRIQFAWFHWYFKILRTLFLSEKTRLYTALRCGICLAKNHVLCFVCILSLDVCVQQSHERVNFITHLMTLNLSPLILTPKRSESLNIFASAL